MEVKVIDVMGTDLTVVNENFEYHLKKNIIKFDNEKDEKLISILQLTNIGVLSDIVVYSFILRHFNLCCKTISKTPSRVGVE